MSSTRLLAPVLAAALTAYASAALAQAAQTDFSQPPQQIPVRPVQQIPGQQIPGQQVPAQYDYNNGQPPAAPVTSSEIDGQPSGAPLQEMQVEEDRPLEYEQQKYAVLQTLDKVTARTDTVTIPVNTPSAVGPVFVEVKTCQKTPPNEKPEAAAFLQVWEAKAQSYQKNPAPAPTSSASQWVFSGWMFASSPALSAMDNPAYDVWLKDCTNSMAASAEK